MKKRRGDDRLKVQEELGINSDIKRLKIIDELIMAMSRDKVIFTSPNKKQQHVTAYITKNGVLDIHKTYEGRVKRYKSLAKIDLKEMESRLENASFDLLNAITEAEIDTKNPKFKDYLIMIERNKGKILEDLGTRHGRELVLDKKRSTEEEFRKNFIIVPFDEASEYKFKSASVCTKDDKFVGRLVYVDGRYFLVTLRFSKKLAGIIGPVPDK